MNPPNLTEQCNQTFNTPQGQITTQGIKTRPAAGPAATFQEALTGGTGRYVGAGGYSSVAVTMPVGTARITLHIKENCSGNA
ncbi:hypothetical protein QZN11_26980 [Streptomyces gramineus]|uniref:hypothetical protein n=1 Tax=Streptomyces gramineus TaxID=910542 RepID=UPI00398BAC70